MILAGWGAMPWRHGAAKTPAERSLSNIKWRQARQNPEPAQTAAAPELASAGAPAPISQPAQPREPAGAPAPAPSSVAAAQGGAGPGALAHSVEGDAASGASGHDACHVESHAESRTQPGFGVLVLPGSRPVDHGERSRAEDQGADWHPYAQAGGSRVTTGRRRSFGDGKDAAANASCEKRASSVKPASI